MIDIPRPAIKLPRRKPYLATGVANLGAQQS